MAEFFREGSALAELQEWSSPNSQTPPEGFSHYKFSLLWRSAKGGLVPSWVLITFNLKTPFSSCLKYLIKVEHTIPFSPMKSLPQIDSLEHLLALNILCFL